VPGRAGHARRRREGGASARPARARHKTPSAAGDGHPSPHGAPGVGDEGPNAPGRRQPAWGHVTLRARPARTPPDARGRAHQGTRAVCPDIAHNASCSTARAAWDHASAARPRRRPDAIARSRAGAPLEARCRERGGATSEVSQGNHRSAASPAHGLQARARRPRLTPTHTPAGRERAIVRGRDRVSPGESRRVRAHGRREPRRRHHVASLPSRRTRSRLLQPHPRRGPHTQGEATSHVAPGAHDASRHGGRA